MLNMKLFYEHNLYLFTHWFSWPWNVFQDVNVKAAPTVREVCCVKKGKIF